MTSITHSCEPNFTPLFDTNTHAPEVANNKRRIFEINWPIVRKKPAKKPPEDMYDVPDDADWLNNPLYEEMRRRW